MSQSPVTVTYSLEAVLTRIEDKIDTFQSGVNQKFETLQRDVDQKFDTVNQKFDTLGKDITDLKVGQATLTEKVEGIDKRLEKLETEQTTLVKDISDLKGFRSLIIPIIVAFISAIVTVGFRTFFMGNNP